MEGLIPHIRADSGPDYHRIELPCREMGVDIEWLKRANSREIWESCKILFFNRIPAFSVIELRALKNKFGFKVVLDMDDYWEVPPGHFLYNNWQKHNYKRKIKEYLELVDFIIVSTEQLWERVVVEWEWNEKIEIVPNALPYDDGQFGADRIESDKCRVMYAAGITHREDVEILKKPLQVVSGSAKIILAGYVEHPEWDAIEREFTTNYYLKNYIRKGALNLDNYMAHYRDADICLAPLRSNFFNSAKSNLKILESATKHLPIICSNFGPYNKDIPGVERCSTPLEWANALYTLIRERNKRIEMGQALGEYCREHFNLKKVNELRRQIFESLWN